MGSFNGSNAKKGSAQNVKSQNIFEKIKSKYILKQILDKIKEKILLEIIKYNKIIQNKLDINLNNYKDFSEKFSSIELELTIIKNDYNKFINILRDEDKVYYHIYFNDNKKEIKKYVLNEYDEVNKIKIRIDYQIKSFFKLFSNCKCI